MAVASQWRLQILKTICKGTGSVSQFIFIMHQTCWNPLKHKHKQEDAGWRSITGQTRVYIVHFKSWSHAGLFCLCLLTTPAVSACTQLHLSDGSFPSKGWQNVLWHQFSLTLGQCLLVPVVYIVRHALLARDAPSVHNWAGTAMYNACISSYLQWRVHPWYMGH